MLRLAAMLALILPLAACGRTGDRAAVRAAAEAFLSAVVAGDGVAACTALSGDARAELESQEGKPCARAVTGIGIKSGEVVHVEVDLVNAKVDLDNGESLFAGRTDAGWRLSALGCKRDGNPAAHPMDCELTA